MANNTTTAVATLPGAPGGAPPDYTAGARYLAKLKGTGAAGMRSSLNLAARLIGFNNLGEVPWNYLDADKLEQLAAAATNTPTERGTQRAPASVRMLVAAIKGACKTSWRAGRMTTDAWTRLRDVKPPAGSRLPAGRDIGAGEKSALLRSIGSDTAAAGARDSAMVAMFMATGLRRAELASLALEDIDLTDGRVTVIGKGDKQREVFMSGGATAALLDWLDIRGRDEGPLFCPIDKGDTLKLDAHLTPAGVSFIIAKRVAASGVKGLTPHDFRRTLAGDMLTANNDIATVSGVLGHSDPRTTARYDRRGAETKRRAALTVEVPYKPRPRVQSRLGV